LKTILGVKDLKVYYPSIYGDYKAVDGVTFKVKTKEIFGIAGESGCGKSTLVEGILRLGVGHIPSGEVVFEEKTNLTNLGDDELRNIRWSRISYVPQGSMNSLNPVIKIREQMLDVIMDHSDIDKKKMEEMVLSALKNVGLPIEVANMFPHELSGGMKQRVILATATLLDSCLIIADEPTTALDVVAQKAILQLLKDLVEIQGITVIMVSHDIAAHAEVDDRIAIMYAGKIVEIGSVYDIFEDPLHPYTRKLIASVPSLGRMRVEHIPGLAPSPLNWPSGCRFHERCVEAREECSGVNPLLVEIQPERYVACHKLVD
jgi:peptide/nickel transport system ATP-binding protein